VVSVRLFIEKVGRDFDLVRLISDGSEAPEYQILSYGLWYMIERIGSIYQNHD
jgi:hypothetical protein